MTLWFCLFENPWSSPLALDYFGCYQELQKQQYLCYLFHLRICFCSQSRISWSQQFLSISFIFPSNVIFSFLMLAVHLFFLLQIIMKLMCSAKLNEKGRTRYTWGKDWSAVVLYNFSKILHVKANKSSEQLCICSPVVAMCVSHAVSVPLSRSQQGVC